MRPPSSTPHTCTMFCAMCIGNSAAMVYHKNKCSAEVGEGGSMTNILNISDLAGNITKQFEGTLYGDVNVSFFLSETSPGKGPKLHTHPYAEVFIVQEGTLTFVVGEETVVATGGQIVIA